MASVRAAVGRAPLTAFIVLTFVLSWLAWLPLVASGATVRPGQLPTHFVGLVGPAVAAVVVAALTGGLPRLWARLTRWRVALGWYLLAAVAPVAVLAVALAVEAAVGAGQPDLAGLRRYSGLPELAIPVVYVLVLLGNGFGEEIGWRGCALPLLQRRHGPIGATALLTVVWAAWHLPQFAVLETYRTMSVMVVPGFVLGLFAGAVVFTWIMAQTDSVLIAALFHASYNMVVATRVGGDLTASISTTVVMAGAVVLLWRQVSARRVDRPGPLQPTPRSVAA